jgi:hypothetical protein
MSMCRLSKNNFINSITQASFVEWAKITRLTPKGGNFHQMEKLGITHIHQKI